MPPARFSGGGGGPRAPSGCLSLCSAASSRLSRRRTRSSQLSSRHLRSKDKVEKLATVVGENGSVLRRVTRAAAAAAAATAALAAPSPTPESPTVLAKEPENSLAQGPLVPVVEIGVSERQSAELHLGRLKSARAPSPTPSLVATAPASHSILISDEESTPQKPEAGRLASVTVSSLMATPQDPKRRGGGASRSASKLRIAQASPGPQDLAGSPASPWQERVLAPILPDNCSTPTGAHIDPQSVRRSLIAPSSPGRQVSLAQKYSLVAKQEKPVRRSSRRIGKKATEEPAASARIICESGGPTGGRAVVNGPWCLAQLEWLWGTIWQGAVPRTFCDGVNVPYLCCPISKPPLAACGC